MMRIFSRKGALPALVLAATLLFYGCSTTGEPSSQPANTPAVQGPFENYTPDEDFPAVDYEKLTVANSVEWVSIPNITMTSYLSQYIANVYGLMEKENWVEVEQDVEIPMDETRIGLSLQFYNGDDYYTDNDNLYNYPVYYFYNDNTVVERMTDYRVSPAKTTSIRYTLPEGVIPRICGYINGFGLEGIEYATLTEPVTRLMNNGALTIQAGEESWQLEKAFLQPENQTAFPRSLGLDFNTEGGIKSWRFIAQPTVPDVQPTFSMDGSWYRFDFYPGLACITDHRQPEAPPCWYEIPENADTDTLALLRSWRALEEK